MELDAGSSSKDHTHHFFSHCAEEAKDCTIKVTMGGGPCLTTAMLTVLIPHPMPRDIEAAFPVGREGETNVFFVSFPSTDIARVIVDSTSNSADITANFVSDNEFQEFKAMHGSAVKAAALAAGYAAPPRTGPSSLVPTASPPGLPLPKTSSELEHDHSSRNDGTENEAGTNPLYKAPGRGDDNRTQGTAVEPPPKRRRLSSGEAKGTTSAISPSQALQDAIASLIWTIGAEFSSTTTHAGATQSTAGAGHDQPITDRQEGSSSPRSGAKVKGKRPIS
ncbi:hypothetical protein FRC04_009186 [Tulasnella sp. 424]|nr:hypothetical protein FRC04_009186 [Tulasnella sp. 424]